MTEPKEITEGRKMAYSKKGQTTDADNAKNGKNRSGRKSLGTKSDISDISDIVLDTPLSVDVLDDEGKLVFLKCDGEVTDNIMIDGKTYGPPKKENLPYLLADKDKVLEYIKNPITTDELYKKAYAYHKSASDLPDELFYDLLVIWDFHTYILDKLHFSPILYLFAVKERGKSRTGKACIYLSRRGVWTETIREPDIIRWGNDHKAAIGFDTKDFPRKLQRANCDDLILARFEMGATASRTLWPEKGAFRDTKTFKLFGPTIVTTNKAVDDILESRCISIDMKPSIRTFNDPILPEDALDLKARFVAFRYLNRNTELAKIINLASGRLGDLMSPLHQVVMTFFPQKLSNLKKIIELVAEQKQEEALDTFEAQVVEVIIEAESQVINGFLPIEIITGLFNEKFNEGKNERFLVSAKTIGRTVKSLGFTSKRSTGGKRGIYYDHDIIDRITTQFRFTESVSESTSQMSEMSLTNHEDEKPTKYTNKDNNFLIAESIRLRQKLSKATDGEKPQIENDLKELVTEGQRREMVYFLDESGQDDLLNSIFSGGEQNEV